MQKKELSFAGLKVRAEELLKNNDPEAPGYKDLKKQKRKLGQKFTSFDSLNSFPSKPLLVWQY